MFSHHYLLTFYCHIEESISFTAKIIIFTFSNEHNNQSLVKKDIRSSDLILSDNFNSHKFRISIHQNHNISAPTPNLCWCWCCPWRETSTSTLGQQSPSAARRGGSRGEGGKEGAAVETREGLLGKLRRVWQRAASRQLAGGNRRRPLMPFYSAAFTSRLNWRSKLSE